MTRHEDMRFKAFLPNAPVPDDFELSLWVRRALRTLPSVPVPENFEHALQRRIQAHRRLTFLRRIGLLSLLVLALAGGGIMLRHLLQKPSATLNAPLRPVLLIEPLTVPAEPPAPSIQHRIHRIPRHSPASPIPGGTHPLPPPEE